MGMFDYDPSALDNLSRDFGYFSGSQNYQQPAGRGMFSSMLPNGSKAQDTRYRMSNMMTPSGPQFGVGGQMGAARDMGSGYQDRLLRRNSGVRPGMLGASRIQPPNAVELARASQMMGPGPGGPPGPQGPMDPRQAVLNAYR